MSTENTQNTLSIRSVLKEDKLDGSNFLTWYRNLRIVLRQEKKDYVLERALPGRPRNNASEADRSAWEKHSNDAIDVCCLMLATMTSELQRQFEMIMSPIEMIAGLKGLFQEQARTERYDTVRSLLQCRLATNAPVSPHVLKMMGYIDDLKRLDAPLHAELAIDIILQSLPACYNQFVMNYNMQNQQKSVMELHNMLKTAEPNIIRKATPDVLMVQKGKVSKKKSSGGKGKGKAGAKPKPKSSAGPDDICRFCKEKGHWRMNCKLFLEGRNAAKKTFDVSSSGIYVIEVNVFSSDNDTWVFDTGCGAHICNNVQALSNSRRLKQGEVELRVGNGAKVPALAVGTCSLVLPSGLILELNNCYFVPAISRNIISVGTLDEEEFDISIKKGLFSLNRDGMFYCSAPRQNGLYILDQSNQVLNIDTKRFKPNVENETFLWHCRLGHISEKRIKKLHSEGLLGSFDFESCEQCESCLMGKMTRAPFNKVNERATELLGLVHSDVCGPMSINARGNYQYFITFTDDFSRFGYVYLMRHKSESFEKFKEFQNEVQTQLGRSIKALRSDRGGEYLSQEFSDHLRECGIISQLTPPGTPQWNGVSERRNRTLLDMVRSMMSHTDLPASLWGYALLTSAFTLNRAPSKSVAKTPYELWTGKPPVLSFLRIWGCEAYVKRLISDKLAPKSDKCYFIGYPRETKAYYFYDRTQNKVFVARDCKFLEREFLSKKDSGSKVHLEEIREGQEAAQPVEEEQQEEPQVIVEPEPVVPEIRRSERIRREPERYQGFLITNCHDILIIDNDEPSNFTEAMMSSDSEKWRKATDSEMDSMSVNQVYSLVDPPDGVRPIECKWIFKKKIDVDGNVQIYKARLVAKGFRQIHGIDYDETYSPVAMMKSIRILLATAAFHDYEIWQMDVKTAFLNGILEEDVYMTQPEGYINPKNAKKVCKLHKSIYGLKQASRSWNLRFDETIKEFGFIRNEDEWCVYRKASGSSIAFLILYVDDILLLGNDVQMLQSVKDWLGTRFSMKDMGEAAYVLGIRIYRDRSKRLIGLCQDSYIDKVLRRFSMENSKKGFTPMVHGTSLSKKDCPVTSSELEHMSKIPYASAVGSIMYAMICTRPDLAYSISMTSRYQSNPGERHWIAVKNILKYLRNTKDKFLVYGGSESLVVSGYTDASFQTDRDSYRSQSGYVFCLNGGAICWKSSKQSTVADSTTEAEYIAASEAAKEAVWIKKFITELGVIPSIADPIALYCDNNGAVAQAKEPRAHQKNKHIERKFHLIREIVDRGDVAISRVSTEENVADPLTKPLHRSKHESHTAAIGLRDIEM